MEELNIMVIMQTSIRFIIEREEETSKAGKSSHNFIKKG